MFVRENKLMRLVFISFFVGEAVRFTVNTARLANKFARTSYSMTEKRYAGRDWALITSAAAFPRARSALIFLNALANSKLAFCF